MKPPTRTWRGEIFICDRCDSLDADCPVCRAAKIRNPYRVQAIERKRGELYHFQCRLVRWLWSPAGRHVNNAADNIIRLSGLAMALSLAMCLVITVGRFLINMC
jgi:hypothetical protein